LHISIIRPKTFDRSELVFSIVSCKSRDKDKVLSDKTLSTIARRLGTTDVKMNAWGIIFAYTPKQACSLFGQFVGNASEYVRTALSTHDPTKLQYGLYCGKMPKELPLNPSGNNQGWDHYKTITLQAFKRGFTRLLIGTTAISVGIDNEYLNYVVNFSMPPSLEAYYQQCGRAGRNEQHSECFLIFSDDRPDWTMRWFTEPDYKMPGRWDDIGTVAFFFQTNFPGIDIEVSEAIQVLTQLLRPQNQDEGWVIVPRIPLNNRNVDADNDPTEKYIAYWLMLGVVQDYEVQGTGINTTYRVRCSDAVEVALRTGDLNVFQHAVVANLHKYLMRYRPVLIEDVETGINQQFGNKPSKKAISYLISFIYREIAYQRKAAIRTMWEYCNSQDITYEHLRSVIKAYFDRSKFSDLLDMMAEAIPSFDPVSEVIEKIGGFDDIEHLYWETRRLLDERYRPDWAAINLFVILYREQTASHASVRALMEMVENLRKDPRLGADGGVGFVAGTFSSIPRLDKHFGRDISTSILMEFFCALYKEFRLDYHSIINELPVSAEAKSTLRMSIMVKQMEDLKDAAKYERIVGRV
jgi:hypothetical protein